MKTTCLTIIITLMPLLSFGQQKKQAKCEAVARELVGSWKFEYAMYSSFKGAPRVKSDVFHTDTIHFFNDLTFEFTSHDSEKIDVRTHTGNWEITDKGKTLVHMNRQSSPAFSEPSLPDLFFPIKLIDSERIRIGYEIYYTDPFFGGHNDNVPVYFTKIE